MGNGMNKILPGLYVGNYRDSKDSAQIQKHQITHIVAIHDTARRLYADKEYLCILASDSPQQNLVQFFPVCNDFIQQARIKGGHVLIHCLAGMSRSVTVAVAYVMSVTSLNWQDALKAVRGARAVANPNIGFQKQLQEFEATRLPEERRRMLEKYRDSPMRETDEEHCQKLILFFNTHMLSRSICEGRCLPRVCPTGACRQGTNRIFRRSRNCQQLTLPDSEGSCSSITPINASAPASPRGSWQRQDSLQRLPCVLYHARDRTESLTSLHSLPPERTCPLSTAASLASIPRRTPSPVSPHGPSPIPSGPWDHRRIPVSLPHSPVESRTPSPSTYHRYANSTLSSTLRRASSITGSAGSAANRSRPLNQQNRGSSREKKTSKAT